MRHGFFAKLLAAAVLVAHAGPLAAAEEEPPPPPPPAPEATPRWAAPRIAPRDRLVLGSLSVARANPLGLQTQVRAGWQRRLFESESPLSRDNFLFLGVFPRLNPAALQVGPLMELQPLSILNLRAGVEHVRFFSAFGYLQSFPSPRADYSDSRLDRLDEDAGASYGSSGVHAFFEPTFQIKLGHVVVRNKLGFEYWDMDLREGDTVFYEATLDTLLPDEGFTLANDFDLLYATDFGLTAGLRHSFVRPVYEARHYPPGEQLGFVENRHHRLGALVAYTFHDHGYSRFNRPTVLLITSWYLSHRWRTGEDVGREVPYVALGFAFQSDFLDY